eukprot:Polyplicarium_translucidae@DN2085_c0_g1_i11.p4
MQEARRGGRAPTASTAFAEADAEAESIVNEALEFEASCSREAEVLLARDRARNTKTRCPICLEAAGVVVALRPCGHVLCDGCGSVDSCPLCRREVERTTRVYL